MMARSPEHFRRTLAWVAVAHLLAALMLMLWSVVTARRTPPQPFINMLPLGSLTKGTVPGRSEGPVVGKQFEAPAPAPPAPAPQPRVAQPSKPEPVPAPEPTVAPETVPAPAPKTVDPSAWSPDKNKPKPQPAKPTPPKTTTAKTRPKVKVDLGNEVVRSTPGPTKPRLHASANVRGTDPDGTGPAAEGVRGKTGPGVAETLADALRASGVDKGVGIGPSGDPNGSGGENSWYYALIRDQMYESWNVPISVAGKKLQTLIRINVEKNGAISNVELIRSSGNKEHDDSALAAVRRVGRISKPLPDGMNPNIDITFAPKD